MVTKFSVWNTGHQFFREAEVDELKENAGFKIMTAAERTALSTATSDVSTLQTGVTDLKTFCGKEAAALPAYASTNYILVNDPLENAVGKLDAALFDGIATSGSVVGAVIWVACEVVPSGHLECDGAHIINTNYPNLFASIGTRWGGTSPTDYYLPDLRGKFPRGWDHGATNDPDRAARVDRLGGIVGDSVGSLQADALKSHLHSQTNLCYASNRTRSGDRYGIRDMTSGNTGYTGGNETRPLNAYLMPCIKY